MTLAHGVHSGANCVAEPRQLRSFENHSTLARGKRLQIEGWLATRMPEILSPSQLG